MKSIAFLTGSSSMILVLMYFKFSSPSSSINFLAFSSLRSKITTLAPLCKKCLTVASPKPDAPPVMAATFPLISITYPFVIFANYILIYECND